MPARGHQRVVLHAARFQTTALILDLSLGSQSKSYCPTPGQSFFFPRLPVRLPFHPTILHPLPIHPFSIHCPSIHRLRVKHALHAHTHCCPPPVTAALLPTPQSPPPSTPSHAPSGAFRVALRRGLAWHSAKAIASGRVRCQSLPAREHQQSSSMLPGTRPHHPWPPAAL